MQDDEQIFGYIDASIRRQCAQKARQEEPWAGGVPGIGLVKKNDLNFMAGAQKRETNSSLSRDNGGHSGGYLPSPMDPKIANGLDAQVTPQLMGMSPDTEDLADSAWLNESADLDEIDIEELANGTTVLELVDLPGDAAEEPQVNEEAQVDTQGEVPSQPDLASDTVTTIDPSLPPQETSAPIQHEPAQPESTQPESAQPESAQPALAQPESLQPESVQPELTPEEELLEQLQHQAIQPTKVEEFQERLDALREDKPAADQAIPVQSVDERFAQVQRLVDGGPTPAQAGPSTSAGATTAAVASTSTGLGAELGRIQAETLVGENTGSHEDQVKELLAQLKETLATAPTPPPGGGGEGAAEEEEEEEEISEVASDDEQVQSLVERAALGDFDEVPEESAPEGSTSPDSLDKQLRQQWRRNWQEQEDRQSQAHLSSELSCELGKIEAVAASVADQASTSHSPPVPALQTSGADMEWTAQEAQRKDVQDAKQLLDKLQHCDRQPAGHERVPLWRAAIALRSATQGIDALQGGNLKVATFLNYVIEEASSGASLQPGDLLQVENFRLKYLKTSALLKAQSIAQQAAATPVQLAADVSASYSDLPDVPTHRPEL